jgi:hypothetical protein
VREKNPGYKRETPASNVVPPALSSAK